MNQRADNILFPCHLYLFPDNRPHCRFAFRVACHLIWRAFSAKTSPKPDRYKRRGDNPPHLHWRRRLAVCIPPGESRPWPREVSCRARSCSRMPGGPTPCGCKPWCARFGNRALPGGFRIAAAQSCGNEWTYSRTRSGRARKPRRREEGKSSGYAIAWLLTVIHNPMQGYFLPATETGGWGAD